MNLDIREAIELHIQRAEWDSVIELSTEAIKNSPGDAFPVRCLEQAYKKLGAADDRIEALRSLVNRHHETVPYARELGLALKKRGDNEESQPYLEQALVSAIHRRENDEIEELWLELVDLGTVSASDFLDFGQKLAARKEKELAGELLTLYLDGSDLDPNGRLNVLKTIVDYVPERQEELRNSLIEAYSEAFSDRPDIDRLIALSGIATEDSVADAMVQLDRFLKFGEGQHFYHNGWGTGKVRRIEPTQQRVFIDFAKKADHALTLEMADKSLVAIPHNDLRARLFDDAKAVKELAGSDSVEVVKAALVAAGGKANAKELKELLLDSVIPEKDWQKWWTAANKVLKSDPYLEVTGSSLKTYLFREKPEGPDEEYARRFRESKTLRGKLDLLTDYLDHRKAKCSPTALEQMAQALLSKASSSRAEGEIVEAVFRIEDLAEKSPVSPESLAKLRDPILNRLDRAVNALEALKSIADQRRWFALMEATLKNELAGAYEKLLFDGPDSIRDLVAEHVQRTHEEDVLSRLFKKVRPICREEPGLFIWLTKGLIADPKATAREGLARPALIEQLVALHEVLAYRAKTSRKEQSKELRAHMSDIRALLKQATFKRLRGILTETDESTARILYKTTEGAVALEDRIRKEILGYVAAHFPKVTSGEGPESSAPELAAPLPARLLCLAESFESKKEHLGRLKTVEIPENTREVEAARLLGDLRENAEYHAAKEKQGVLLSLSSQIEHEIASASVIPLDRIESANVGFGSQVVLREIEGDRTLTILGPWESIPEENILSYESPLGRAMWGRSVGDTFEMERGGQRVPAEIVSIEPISETPMALKDKLKTESVLAEAKAEE